MGAVIDMVPIFLGIVGMTAVGACVLMAFYDVFVPERFEKRGVRKR